MESSHNNSVVETITKEEPFTWLSNLLQELLDNDPELALAPGTMSALTEVIKRSQEGTLMGLRRELEDATSFLLKSFGSRSISLKSGADIFMRFVTRTTLEITDFHACKMRLVERAKILKAQTLTARKHISCLTDSFLRDGMIIMTHGYSRVVFNAIKTAASREKRIRVILTEARPGSNSIMASRISAEANVPVTLIPDSAAAFMMNDVDMVIVGAEAVVENGGIINKIGTYQLSLLAKALNKPFYVAVESFKMTRSYPLNQHEIENQRIPLAPMEGKYQHRQFENVTNEPQLIAPNITLDSPLLDLTPPHYITLLFTDLGILTPSAVSDELIKLYY